MRILNFALFDRLIDLKKVLLFNILITVVAISHFMQDMKNIKNKAVEKVRHHKKRCRQLLTKTNHTG